MDRKFRRLSDGIEVDLIPYLKEELSESKDIRMYVGTDSQNVGSKTIYATVIVLHKGNRGGHVIYSKKYVNRITEKFTKLWNEVQDSVDLAQYLESNGIEKPAYIDLDFNPDPRYQSNTILRTALGYVESLGFVPRCKPEAVSASYVADKICK